MEDPAPKRGCRNPPLIPFTPLPEHLNRPDRLPSVGPPLRIGRPPRGSRPGLSRARRALEVVATVFLTAGGGGDPIVTTHKGSTTNHGSIRGIVPDHRGRLEAIEALAMCAPSNVESTQREELHGGWR